MRLEALIQRIEEERARCAHDALASPQGRDAFEFGRSVGFYAGLAKAKDILDSMIDDEREKHL